MGEIKKILLVEDNTLLNDGISLIVNKWENFDLTSVFNAEDGLDKLQYQTFDLLLLDIKLPKMNGLELLTKIREEGNNIKVMLLTEFKDKEYIYESVKLGALGFMTKDIKMEILREAVDTVLKGEKYFPSEVSNILIDYYASPDFGKNIVDLNEKQIIILQHMANGLNSKEIGDKIFLSPRTIDSVRAEMIKKFNAKNSNELISIAIRKGLIS